ncbi:uncharacterized protein VTP21DRAFT_4421 [Calcarisporiella thermophila]|uniref:uncharacterized protein n=1 Tax=Calcarisporiella thermophila TaxID=911321 RepID=UPI0037434383
MAKPRPIKQLKEENDSPNESPHSFKDATTRLSSSASRSFLSSSPGHRPLTPDIATVVGEGSASRLSQSASGNDKDAPILSVDLPSDLMADIVRRHLATNSGTGGVSGDDDIEEEEDEVGSIRNFTQNYHQLPGGAVTHDVYKWHAEHAELDGLKRNRSQSFFLPRSLNSDPTLSLLGQPGGFRRHFVLKQLRDQGRQPPNFITKSFIDFLAMYGHFAGEDLSDDDEEEEEEEDGEDERVARDRSLATEQTPLVTKSTESTHGTASASKAVFLLLKSFVGTGVLFLPKAFYNGGLLFSSLVLLGIALISLISFILLVDTRAVVHGSFGDIGGALFGQKMRIAVLFSITISQIGFVCAYMVFVSQNLQSLVLSFSNCKTTVPLHWFIVAQLFVFIPLAMIRKISKLSFFALIADLFIMAGLFYIYYYDFHTLLTAGIGKIALFNPRDWNLLIGTAVFTFEGVGLVIPITESMKNPAQFPAVLTGVMAFVTVIFTSVAVLSYLAFGDKVQTIVLLNLPASPAVDSIQLLYSIAILLSIPLQLFPAIRILETGLIVGSGKYNPWIKWRKNMFRFTTVVLCALIAWGGASDLDKFVSLVGSAACLPLCFIYPPLFHYKAVARSTLAKTGDILLLCFGILATTYTTMMTIRDWASGGGAQPIGRCH